MSFSRGPRRLIAFAFLLIGAAACGLKVGEKAPEDRPLVIGGSGLSCLSKIPEKTDEYLSGRLKNEEVRDYVGCIRYAFESFARRTRGSDRNSFTPAEIRDFLHEYFLKDRKISDELLRDAMVIKQTLLGGTLDRVSRWDLSQAIDTLNFLEEQLVYLNPHMEIYNFNIGRLWMMREQGRGAEVDRAVEALREVAERVGRRLARANSPYPLAHLESFMREFRRFSGWEQVFTNARRPESWSRFVSAYKSVVAGSEGDVIRPGDWPTLLVSAAQLYGVTLRARYARERQSLFYGDGLEATVRVADDIIAFLQTSVDRQAKKVVSYQQIDNLIDALAPFDLLPRVPSADSENGRSIRPETLKKTLRMLIDRVFGDPQVPWRERKSDGISRLVLAQMTGEFTRWAEVQRYLDRTFSAEDKSGQSGRLETLAERLGPIGASESLMKLIGKGADKDSVASLVRSMEQTLRPLFRPGENQVFLTESNQLAKYQVVHGFHNLSQMNLVRALVALVARGYSSYRGGEGPFDGGVSEEEMQAFYLDLHELGVDLQIFSPQKTNAGVRSFREANLFTYAGNGVIFNEPVKDPKDALMTFAEAVEYVSFIFSGSVLARSIYSGMMNSREGLCYGDSREAPVSPINGVRMVERNCFRQHLLNLLLARLETMPTMKRELEQANQNQRLNMVDNLMGTIFTPGVSNPNFIDWQEISSISVITHYTESVMTRYNRNQDSNLETEEVWAAYQTFRGYMSLMAAERCGQVVEALYKPTGRIAEWNQRMIAKFGWDEMKDKVKEWIKVKGCRSIPEFVSAGIFAHIVKHGKVPTSLWEINYVPRWPYFGIDFEVGRTELLKVFAALVQANAEATAKKKK